jgi:hypothetical protein
MIGDRNFNKSRGWRRKERPPPVPLPVISGVTLTNLTDTSVTISWTINVAADGFIEYGLTDSYGSSTTIETDLLTFHSQVVPSVGFPALVAGTQYYYRIVSKDSSGNAGYYESSFTTSGSIPAPSVSVFGPGVPAIATSGGGKQNVRMTNGSIGIRFTAHASSQVSSITLPFSNRTTGYGSGNGGTYRIGIQALNASGLPTGTFLGQSVDFTTPILTSPASWSKRMNFSSGPTLVAGTNYAVVIQNIGSSPDSNWTSYNIPWNPASRPFPMHEDEAFYMPSGDNSRLVLANSTYGTAGTWITSGSSKFETYPSMALAYANGTYEGFAGINARLATNEVGNVTSSTTCTWKWTHYGSGITFATVGVLAYRISGTADMTVTVKKGGVSQATGTFLTSSDLGGDSSYNWIESTLSGNVSATAGDVMEVVFATASGEYVIPTILCHESGTDASQRMLSMPFLGDTATRHQALEGTGFAFSSWSSYSTFMCYVRTI